jgi:hypothetical protein
MGLRYGIGQMRLTLFAVLDPAGIPTIKAIFGYPIKRVRINYVAIQCLAHPQQRRRAGPLASDIHVHRDLLTSGPAGTHHGFTPGYGDRRPYPYDERGSPHRPVAPALLAVAVHPVYGAGILLA